MTTPGGLPPRRPDQYEATTPRSVQPGARIARLGGTPNSASAVGMGAQGPTAFITFPAAARLFAAELSFAVGTNGTYSGGVTQLYAQVATLSGIILGTVELAVSGPLQAVNGQGGLTFPETGVPVAKGDKLRLDVNNNVSLGTFGVMRATASVFYAIP